ncbi:Protein of unknown function DUF1639 [Macleaya cordata]|uniref:DUF1639 domain-containing protein n=1 Tax=Macleaya cordata TaxID=56857 RepID=A0A200Q2I2_MACCD|nr:Protein of unknown function DUF1639 [Macleaya cordata]
MATVPVRSQPLHNFSLPFLKWGKNQMNNNCCRKLVDSSSSQQQEEEESPSVDHNSSSDASKVESNGGEKEVELENRKNSIASRSVKNRLSPPLMEKPQKKNPILSESETGINEVKLMKLESGGRNRIANKDELMEKNKSADGGEGVVEGESAAKPWNLRPRRVVFKSPNEIAGGGASKNGEVQEKPENLPKSLRLRGLVDGQNVENKEKRKFWISLSREEIEEDFFVLTGSKPPRRPKKRARNIQKQVDNVFPGLWLAGITADSYSVPDGPAKR